ncbi:MAG: hypothetical protein ACPGXL_07160 [Chitinophagales bacterium]
MLNTLLITVISGIAQLILPWWWIIAIVAGMVALFSDMKGVAAFVSGFLAIILLWGVYAISVNINNSGILSARIAELFQLSSGGMVILLTLLIGGLIGGLGAWSGSNLKTLFVR